MNWLNDIKNLKLPPLKKGSHRSTEEGVCAMEMVAFIERLPHSDSPQCTCPVIAAFVRSINDHFDDEYRQKLLPYLPRLVGTVSKPHESERATFLAWQAIHIFAPIALRSVGLNDHANKLENFNGKLVAARAAAYSAALVAADAADAGAAARSAAAGAAYAAADAAYAADVADVAYAAYAALAASYAVDADVADVADVNNLILKTLDELLEIGPKGNWTKYQTDRVKEIVYL